MDTEKFHHLRIVEDMTNHVSTVHMRNQYCFRLDWIVAFLETLLETYSERCIYSGRRTPQRSHGFLNAWNLLSETTSVRSSCLKGHNEWNYWHWDSFIKLATNRFIHKSIYTHNCCSWKSHNVGKTFASNLFLTVCTFTVMCKITAI